MENDNDAHSAPVKIEALDEALSESQASPPSQLAVHLLVPESGCGNLDLPPSPPPLPLVSESVVPETNDELSMQMCPPGFQTTYEPPLKKRRNMHQKPDQSIQACKIEVETAPLVSGTVETDTHGEEQLEVQQMDLNYREDEVSNRSPAEMAPQGIVPRNLETNAPSRSDTIVSTGQRRTITQDTPSGAGDTAAASAQDDGRHIEGPRRQDQTNVKKKSLHSKALSRKIHQKSHQQPIETPAQMSQHAHRPWSDVVGDRIRKDRVSDMLWFPNREHLISDAADGCADMTTTRHNLMKIKYHKKMAGTLRQMGLHQLATMSDHRHDGGLFAGLIERWRPETHSFHLPHAEMTVTLQDVSCLWGLPITGEPVTGVEYGDYRGLCLELLGYPAEELAKTRTRGEKVVTKQNVINLGKLRSRFDHLANDADATRVAQYTRAFILELFTCRMFPDSMGDVVRLCFLPFLRDLTTAGKYNWGAAVLACLYRGLCMACQKSTRTFIGPCMLLLHWSYARFPIARPRPKTPSDIPSWGEPDFENCPAYGAQYCCKHMFIGTVHGTTAGITYYRQQIELLKDDPDWVTWEPYEQRVELTDGSWRSMMQLLPDRCREHRHYWLAEVPLVYFQVIEHYYPGRVMRQFGLRQQCPPPEPISETVWRQLHGAKDTTSGKDWRLTHTDYVARAYAPDPPLAGSDDLMQQRPRPYREWYVENCAYTIFLEGCIADNINERVPMPRDQRGNVHGLIPAGLPMACMSLMNLKSCVIAAQMAMMSGWKRIGKVLLKHNCPAVCAAGYKSRLDRLLICIGCPTTDHIDAIDDSEDIFRPYSGDEDCFRMVQDAATVNEVFEAGHAWAAELHPDCGEGQVQTLLSSAKEAKCDRINGGCEIGSI